MFVFVPVTINLEKCTVNHFSSLSGIDNNYGNWDVDTWYCFPINQTYSIGGNQILGNYWYLSVKATCNNPTNCQSAQKSLSVDLITLDYFINPANASQHLMAYLNKKQSIIQSGASISNTILIDQHILKTDNSLTPF